MSEQNNGEPGTSVSKEELFEVVVALDIKKFRCKIFKPTKASKEGILDHLHRNHQRSKYLPVKPKHDQPAQFNQPKGSNFKIFT